MTTITEPAQFERFRIAQVRGVCRLLHAGLKQRGMTKRKAADAAGAITGKKYKDIDLLQAADDITAHLRQQNIDMLAKRAKDKYGLDDTADHFDDALMADPYANLEELFIEVVMKVSYP